MNIIFCGSKGKTGSVIYNYLKEQGYAINHEVNLNENKLKDIIKKNSIIIDFTNSETALKHAYLCLENNSHFICGTTGIQEDKIKEILSKSKQNKLNFIFNPNFSLGITKIIPLLHSLSTSFNDIKIIESHHISKLDLPSGTAHLLKKEIKKDVPIESIRTTFKSLDHTIIFNNEYEEITITHKVKNKLAYAKGVKECLDYISTTNQYNTN